MDRLIWQGRRAQQEETEKSRKKYRSRSRNSVKGVITRTAACVYTVGMMRRKGRVQGGYTYKQGVREVA